MVVADPLMAAAGVGGIWKTAGARMGIAWDGRAGVAAL